MLLNFIKIALRNIYSKSTFSSLNILGLTLGIAAFTLIFRYVLFELSYDNFHQNKEEVYSFALVNEKQTGAVTYHQLPTAIKKELINIPELVAVGRFNQIDYQNNSIIYEANGEKKVFEETGLYFVEPAFEELLGFGLSKGSIQELNKPFKIVLSANTAQKLFNDKDPIGQQVTLSGNVGAYDYEVVGVLEKLPLNTAFKFGGLLSFASEKIIYGEDDSDWWNNWTDTYLIRKNVGVEAKSLEDKLSNLLANKPALKEREGTWKVQLTAINELYFQNDGFPLATKNGNLQMVIVLSIIGLFTLLIAYINYINLSTARAMERAKEVGIRKVMGSSLKLLRIQFTAEAFLLNIIAFVLSLVIVQWAMPIFKDISNPMLISEQYIGLYWGTLAIVVLIGSLLSGVYPAFVMSSFKPVTIVKGKLGKSGKGNLLRKILVVFQYAASITLLAGTITIQKQLDYMNHKDLGINIEQLLILNAPPGSLVGDNKAFFTTLDNFKTELLTYPAIDAMAISSAVPGKEISWGGVLAKPADETYQNISLIACDKDYAKTYGIELLAGRFYNDSDQTFGNGNIVINTKAANLLGFEIPEEAIGKKLKGGDMFPEVTIVGVMKNHHHGSLHEAYAPIAYVKSVWSNYYSVKLGKNTPLTPEQIKSTLELIRLEWDKTFPGAPFEYVFAEDTFNAQYMADKNFMLIINIFTVLAILIASLGLLGLSSYNMMQRSKEMGIRKVLGATGNSLFLMLSREYVILLLISGVLSIPLAWYLMESWLDNYAFRIDLGVWLGAFPILIIMFIAMGTIILQILRTIETNPVESLRND